MVLKSLRAAAILLVASLFKIVCIIQLKYFQFFILTNLYIIYLCFCGMKIDTDGFEKSESCCNLLVARLFKIFCIIILKYLQIFILAYSSIIYHCFVVVQKYLQIVFKSLRATAILLVATLFKMV